MENKYYSYVKIIILISILLYIPNVFAFESSTTGEAFSTSKADACNKALDHARESAAQQARVYISSKYDRRIEQLSGEVVDNVTHQTYQSTFGITELEEIIEKKSNYDEETGSITCHVHARFNVDANAVTKELEARISLEEAKIKEANRKSKLLMTLKANESSYMKIKDKADKYDMAVYTGSVICKESYSVSNCKNELVEKFEKEKAAEISQELNISNKYVSVIFDDFEGDEEHKTLEEYDDAFVITMTGEFNYEVNVSDPYIEANNQIINELAMANGYKVNDGDDTYGSGSSLNEDEDYMDTESWGDSGSIFSDIRGDIALIKGDVFGFNDLIDLGKSQAYIDSMIQLGLIFDVGEASNKNLMRVAIYSGNINIHTCLSVDLSDKCDSLSTIDTNARGIGLEAIFEGAILMNFGGVYYKVEDKDIIGTDFIQIKLGISNKGPGLYVYADMYSLIPTSKSDTRDIEPSLDISFGMGVRF